MSTRGDVESYSSETDTARPAFYALARGGWRDYVTLLHPPYTAWHLSYVVIGAAVAPRFSVDRLWPVMLAFFLAVGIGAHALDELHGHPLGTMIPRRVLVGLGTVSILAAGLIGAVGALTVSGWLWLFVGFGVFMVIAYNLELWGGRFHTDAWFAVGWGSFPALTGYFTAEHALQFTALAVCTFAYTLSTVQRRLSTHVRGVRRRVQSVTGTIRYRDGAVRSIDQPVLIQVAESALRTLCLSTVLLAAMLIIFRVE